MNKIILDELQTKIALAIETGLIPSNEYKELEFTVDVHGRASYIEFWSCSARRDSDRTVVEIPADLQSRFVFRSTATYL
jgi:hypothetical protein